MKVSDRERYRRLRAAAVLACVLGSGCVMPTGMLPRIATVSDVEGFKLLKLGAEGTACESALGEASSGIRDLLAEAFSAVLQQDQEATSVLQAHVVWHWEGWLPYRCATIRGDLVRSTSAVVLPMAGGGHEGHGASPR